MAKKRRRFYLREWRIFRGKTQQQVADALGITKTHVSNVERGERRYNDDIVEAAAKFLDIEPEYLFAVDPTDPNSIWATLELAKSIPVDRLSDWRRITRALSERDAEPYEAEKVQPSRTPPKRRR